MTWRDGDLLRELGGRSVSKWDWKKGVEPEIYATLGQASGRGDCLRRRQS